VHPPPRGTIRPCLEKQTSCPRILDPPDFRHLMWPDSLRSWTWAPRRVSGRQARQAGVARVIGYSAITADASQALGPGPSAIGPAWPGRAGAPTSSWSREPGCRHALARARAPLEPGAIVTDLARSAGPCETVRDRGCRSGTPGPVGRRRARDRVPRSSARAVPGRDGYICPRHPTTPQRGGRPLLVRRPEAQPVTVSAGTIDERTAWR
jgi:hypothetical protein